MNERIKELVKQAGINLTPAQFSGVLEDEVSEFDLDKFAELIVKECAEYLSTTDYSDVAGDHNRALEIAAIDILEHFGIEE